MIPRNIFRHLYYYFTLFLLYVLSFPFHKESSFSHYPDGIILTPRFPFTHFLFNMMLSTETSLHFSRNISGHPDTAQMFSLSIKFIQTLLLIFLAHGMFTTVLFLDSWGFASPFYIIIIFLNLMQF